MREYLFISQMTKASRKVFMGNIAHAIRLAAKYADYTEQVHMQMPYELGDITSPQELSFYGIVRRQNSSNE